jgi:hypothetical protein
VRLCQCFCCGGKVLLRPEKKVLVVCLAGARSLLRPEKKSSCDRYYDRKKSSSRLSGGCAIVITTGKKCSSRNSYYDGKKTFYSSVWRVPIVIKTGIKKSSSRDFYAKLNVSNLNVTNLY